MLGTIDFCRCFYAYNNINNCARNAALFASDPYSNTFSPLWTTTAPTSYSPYIKATENASVAAAAQADATNLTPTPTVGPSDPTYGKDSANNKTVTVTVYYTFTPLSSYILGETTFVMSRAVTMRVSPPLPN